MRLSPLFGILLFSVFFNGLSVPQSSAQSEKPNVSATSPSIKIAHPDWSYVSLGLIPIQSGGRVKPLDSFAREVVLFTTGSRSFQGWNSIDLMLSWMTSPEYWNQQPLIRINREDVRRQLGLDERQTYFSPQELFKNPILLQYAQRAGQDTTAMEPPGSKSDPREQELKAVLNRISTFHGIISGQGWLLVPKPVPASWSSLVDQDREGELIRGQFAKLIKSFQAGDEKEFTRSSQLLRSAIEGEIPSFQENEQYKIAAESLYNRSRPFLFAWVFYFSAALIWTMSQTLTHSGRQKTLTRLALLLTSTAVFSHIFGFALRCYVAGRPPVTNMYESIIWVSLGVMLFASILYLIHRQGVILAVACALATLGLIAGDAAPAMLDPSIQPLVPVLRSNYWLTVHVLTITLGYAAFALTLGLANISLFQFLKKDKGRSIASLNQLTYRAMQFGVVLIAAGTILGGIWADYSWGRFWGWDPKEVWALITLLAYLVILHGRYTTWVGQFGFAAWSAVSFLTVIMAWYGVNFILGAGLHSYGFATGGTPWVAGFVILELAYVMVVTAVYFKNQKRTASRKIENQKAISNSDALRPHSVT
jgi:cytochrome c-type biogenesis protein CcsB